MTVVIELLSEALVIAGILLMLLCLLTGAVFLFAPRVATSMEHEADQKFSLRKALKPVEIPRQTERFFYKHHRSVGILVALLAGLFLWMYLVAGEGSRIAEWLGRQAGGELLAAWSAGIGGFLVVMNVLALVFGIVMAVRPSALKGVEVVANRWVSTRRATKALDSEHDPLGRFAMNHPRLFGAVVLVGSLFVLLNLMLAGRG
ncbi:MAG: hypothetical protein R3270_10575 [Gammaproteobacteria bacterium]|nr:hypothetical protein [Gammaproteobacteria bacterium]